jgi:hypothetical protein
MSQPQDAIRSHIIDIVTALRPHLTATPIDFDALQVALTLAMHRLESIQMIVLKRRNTISSKRTTKK